MPQIPKFERSVKVKPITPEEAENRRFGLIPDEVVLAINKLLTTNPCIRGDISIQQEEIIKEASAMMKANGKQFTRNDFFEKDWLKFEDQYRKAGWKIIYDYLEKNEPVRTRWIFRY